MNVLSKKIILLAGASGYIGSAVFDELHLREYIVVRIGRKLKPINTQGANSDITLDMDLGNTFCEKKLKEMLPSCFAVISCLGSREGKLVDSWNVEFLANKNLLNYATSVGCERFVLLSAICVQKPKLEFQKAKLAFEALLISSKLIYSIVRPTAFFKSLSGQINRVRSGKPFIVFDSGEKTSCKPISRADLARYICECLTNTSREKKILPIGGPGPAVTPNDQADLLFKNTKHKKKIRRVPSWIFLLFAFLLTPFCFLSTKLANLREFMRIAHFYATESMLVWDEQAKKYSDQKTLETGFDKLEDFYKEQFQDINKKISMADKRIFR